jgi:hypothetical protein
MGLINKTYLLLCLLIAAGGTAIAQHRVKPADAANLNTTQTTSTTATGTMPTKYAVVLYTDSVTDKQGSFQKMASHLVNRGGGTLTWKKDVLLTGDYELAISYSAKAAGSLVKVSAEANSIQAGLAVTEGYYPADRSEWSAFNCERKLIPGILRLTKGMNTITVAIDGSKENEINLYSLELIPVANKSAVLKDLAKAAKAKPEMNWFTQSPYGLMFHWTSQSAPQTGPIKPYNQAVNDFDVNAFVKMVQQTGASYIIFTMNHAEPYFPAPLKSWETEYPGHTTQRDLVAEISDGLSKHNIKLILYLATHIYAQFDKVNDEKFNQLNFSLLSEIGERYKKKVAGYWLDGWYQSYAKHPDFDFEQLYTVCKKGNPNRLLTLNSWVYPINTTWQDYWSGEFYNIGNPATTRILENGPGKGMQAQSLIVMESDDWLHQPLDTKIKAPTLKTNELVNFINAQKGNGPVTVNIQIYQDGRISPEALQVMETVKQQVLK